TNSPMYHHMIDDMDINAGVILEGTPVEAVGRQIFEEILAGASGKKTKSEQSGVGEEEVAPWRIGPTLETRKEPQRERGHREERKRKTNQPPETQNNSGERGSDFPGGFLCALCVSVVNIREELPCPS